MSPTTKFRVQFTAGRGRDEEIEADRYYQEKEWMVFARGEAGTPQAEEVSRIKADRVARIDRVEGEA